MNKTSDVAVIGAGIMGTAIATRLLETNNRVRVFDLDTEKITKLVERGAAASKSPGEATKDSDFVILSLNHADIVRNVVFGQNGVATSATAGKTLIDMSSIDPAETAKMANQLASETGMKWVDCPLSGGAPRALTGELTIMAGGEKADFDNAFAVMQHLSANYTLMGPSGAGQTTKLINQLFCAVAFQAVAEAVKLAEAGGGEPHHYSRSTRRWTRRQPHYAGVHGQIRRARLQPHRPHRQHAERPGLSSGICYENQNSVANDRSGRGNPSTAVCSRIRRQGFNRNDAPA